MQKSRLPMIVLACIALIAVPLGLYGGAYFGLSTAYPVTTTALDEPTGPFVRQILIRQFPQRWMAVVFEPAAKVESWLRREQVQVEPGVLLELL